MPSKVIGVTTTPQRVTLKDARVVMIKNDGAGTLYWSIDNDANASIDAGLAAAESITIDLYANDIKDTDFLSLVGSAVATVRVWWL